jgi:diguanylate cyclase (GGDEF)-like protein/PAS domain S-box-containing protein
VTLRRALSANFAFLTLLILAVLAAVTGTAYVIERQKNIALAEGLDLSALHARAFEEHLTRSLKTIQALVDFIAVGPDEDNIDELFQRTLRQAPFLRSLSMLDTSGRIIASSNPGNIGLPLETGDYFPQVAASHGSPLRIGRPWSGRDFYDGREVSAEHPTPSADLGFIPVLCRVEHNGREVRITAALNPDFFINYFTQWLLPKEGFVEILRYDRMLLLTNGELSLTGEQHPDRVLARLLEESEIGRYHGEREGLGETCTAFRVSRQFPLIVVTHLFKNRALAHWRRESGRLLLLAAPALLAMVYLATALYRRDQRIATAQEAARRREYERLAATVFETVLEAVMVTDADQRIIAVNPAFTRITGYTAEEAVGADFSLLASGYHPDEFFQAVQQSLNSRGRWEGEVRNRRKTGEIFVAWLSINQVLNDAGQVLHHVTGFSDITEYCVEAERISHLAHHDLLTGLPNRALLLDRLHQGLRQAYRNSGKLALLFFDLDKFKPVNDTLGHTVGDRLLQALSARLLGEIRDADTLARLGGDEFIILLPVVRDGSDALVVAEKIRQAVELPFLIDHQHISISTSIGIAFYPDHATDADGLIQCADSAMYLAKADGGNRFTLYRG